MIVRVGRAQNETLKMSTRIFHDFKNMNQRKGLVIGNKNRLVKIFFTFVILLNVVGLFCVSLYQRTNTDPVILTKFRTIIIEMSYDRF